MKEVSAWLLANFPSIFLMIVGGVIAWFIFKFYNRFTHTEKECKKIPPIQETVNLSKSVSDRIEKNLDDKILPKLDSLALTINSLLLHMGQKDKDFKSELFVIKSPVQLSDIGLAILDKIGGKKFLEENKTNLITILENENIKSSLDVQNQSIMAILKQVDKDEFVPIKNYLYNNPVFKDGESEISLTVPIIAQIMGIYLRNLYLSVHPEIAPE